MQSKIKACDFIDLYENISEKLSIKNEMIGAKQAVKFIGKNRLFNKFNSY
jgi:SOS-response transcriptional repressor LexA